MSTDYTPLDEAIVEHIAKTGGPTWGNILSHLEPLADSIAPRKFGQRDGWRALDRRLQALRKAGRIKPERHGRFSFWVLVEGGAA